MSEIIELRTESAKTFNLGSGKRQIIANPSPIHYKDVNDNWIDLITDINIDTVDKTIYSAKLLSNAFGYEVTNKSDSKTTTVKLVDIEGVVPTYFAPTILGNEAKWVEIVPNVDLIIRFYESKVRTWRLLKTSTAPKKINWEVDEDEVLGDMIFLGDIWGIDDAKLETVSSRIPTLNPASNGRTISYHEDTFDNKVLAIDPVTRRRSESLDVTYPVFIDADVDVKPTVSGDDGFANETGSGGKYFNPAALSAQVRYWDYYGAPKGEKAWTRYPGITIPMGATIDDANVKLFSLAGTTNPIISIQAKNLSNPAAPINFTQAWSPATLTTNPLVQTLASTVGSYIDFDVKSRVQGLVDSWGYSNEAMLFFINPKQIAGNINKRFYFNNFDSGTTAEYPNLVINYTVAGGSDNIGLNLGSAF